MSNSYLLYATLAMALVTFITRALPALIPTHYLDQAWLHRLNERLPLAVLVLLILTSLSYQGILQGYVDIYFDTYFDSAAAASTQVAANMPLLMAQIGALVIVLAVYHVSRQLLLSMITGIAVLNTILWWLN